MKYFLLIISLFLTFTFCATAQIVNPGSVLQNDTTVRYGHLDNGMTYYIMHNEKPADRAEFYLVTNAGAIQETPAQSGLAHFLEHMCLNGTKNLPDKQIISYFETVGAKFGENINAGTGVEQTMYMLNNIPLTRQGIIDTALLVLHDYSHFVSNDPVEIEKERGVLVEEWRTIRTSDWRMHESELPYLYKGSKYAECTLIGSKDNLETFPPQELISFYTTWYRPDLQAVIIVGDVDVDAIEDQLKRLLADIPASVNPQPKVLPEIPNNVEPIVAVITDPEATETSVSVYFKEDPMPLQYRPLGLAYLTEMMKDIMSSMINERLSDISRQPDAPFLSAYVSFTSICRAKDAFKGNITSREGKAAVDAFYAMMTELQKVKRFGFTEGEFERTKTNLLRNLERRRDNASSRSNSQLVNPLIYNFLFGYPYMTPEYEYNLATGYMSVLPLAQFNQLASQLNLDSNAVVIYKSLEKEGLEQPTPDMFTTAIAAAAAADIKAPVQEAALEPLLDPTVLKGSKIKKETSGSFSSVEWKLKNGINVIVRPSDVQKEEVSLEITNAGGCSLIETSELPNILDAFVNMYSQTSGISKFPATTLSKMLTGKIARVSPFINDFYHGFNASCSPKDIETMFQLLYLSYTSPRFVEGEFKPALDQLKAIIPNFLLQPQYYVMKESSEVIYGDNPRLRLISEEALNNFNYSSMEKSLRTLFSNAAGATVTIVGNVNTDELKPLVEKYIGSLPIGKKTTKIIDHPFDMAKGIINHPFEVKMAVPKVTSLVVYTGDKSFTPKNLILMDATTHILYMVYTQSIREDEGGTYGVTLLGIINPLPKNEFILQIIFETDPEKAERLTQLVKDQFNELARKGPSSEHLQKAKENLLKSISEKRITNSYWEKCLSNKNLYNIDTDADYEKIANSLTAEDISSFLSGILSQGNEITFLMKPKQ